MKPRMEKMTKPAYTLVAQLVMLMMTLSLMERKTGQVQGMQLASLCLPWARRGLGDGESFRNRSAPILFPSLLWVFSNEPEALESLQTFGAPLSPPMLSLMPAFSIHPPMTGSRCSLPGTSRP